MKKRARFFCENCQTEVKGNARFCGHCGRFFAAVKCPACGKTGASHLFTNGCPQCGYAVGKSNNDDSNSTLQEKNQIQKSNLGKKNNFFNFFSKKQSNKDTQKKYSEDSLPLWIYVVALLILIIVIIAFFNL